jgi:hypothetical protein
MAKRRNSKRHGRLTDFEAKWLLGPDDNDNSVFMYSLTHNFIKRELWDRAGDTDNMFWTEGMRYPAPIGAEEDEKYWRDGMLHEKFCRQRS